MTSKRKPSGVTAPEGLTWLPYPGIGKMPLDTLCLVECKSHRIPYQTMRVTHNSSGWRVGYVGTGFHWDIKITRYAVIEHLKPKEPLERPTAS